MRPREGEKGKAREAEKTEDRNVKSLGEGSLESLKPMQKGGDRRKDQTLPPPEPGLGQKEPFWVVLT